MIRRYIYFSVVLVAVFLISIFARQPFAKADGEPENAQYLKFSHSLHIKEQGIGCEDCHTLVKASKFSSDNLMVNHESCQSCHEEQISSDCAFCHTNPDDISPIPPKERELVFSHELHTTKFSVECTTCHSGTENVQYVSNKNMPVMTTCINCHTEKSASKQCESCHTNFTDLLPKNHLVANFKKEHSSFARVGMTDVTCATCHTESFCQDCHTGTELNNFGIGKDLMTEPSGRSSTKHSSKQMRLQQIHELNYRFTHGIDARGKSNDCASCHDNKSFCADCHEAGGNITQQKFKPHSHSVAGFVFPRGLSANGGRHAELARRDIESCMSCHDVEGKDPICAMCHF
ncbi:MAG: hypothetical protein KGZ58_10375 [Ignavibacteriales bacterium]|nr:hypothetical protein [Ignavibacteriales bacterium]